jgi:hypothetical protein
MTGKLECEGVHLDKLMNTIQKEYEKWSKFLAVVDVRPTSYQFLLLFAIESVYLVSTLTVENKSLFL